MAIPIASTRAFVIFLTLGTCTVGCAGAAVGLPLAIPATTGPAPAPATDAARSRGWRSDLDVLVREVRRQHYLYRATPLPMGFVSGIERLKASVERFDDERLLAEAGRLMVMLGDGHTYLLPAMATRVPGRWLPLQCYAFPDGVYVVSAPPTYADLVGSRVERVGDLTAAQALTRVAPFVPKDNAMGVQWMGPFALRFRGILDAIGAGAGSSLAMQFTLRDGTRVSRAVTFEPVTDLRGVPKLGPSPLSPSVPAYLTDVAREFWIREWPHAVYVQFNQVRDRRDESLASFAQRLDRTFAARAPRAVIVDVRHNNGGDASLLEPLLDVLVRFGQTRNSRLVVLTGRNTFSAAQIFITRLHARTHVIFAGERSSSKPNFVGEENTFQLPWSGAVGSISNEYHEQAPGDSRPWLPIDWPIPLSAADYFAGRDPVLETVLDRAGRVRTNDPVRIRPGRR